MKMQTGCAKSAAFGCRLSSLPTSCLWKNSYVLVVHLFHISKTSSKSIPKYCILSPNIFLLSDKMLNLVMMSSTIVFHRRRNIQWMMMPIFYVIINNTITIIKKYVNTFVLMGKVRGKVLLSWEEGNLDSITAQNIGLCVSKC